MKKIKLFTLLASIPTIGMIATPLTSCGGDKTPTAINKIEVTTKPTKLSYKVGDKLKLDGMVVTATSSDGKTSVVTSECTTNPDANTPLTLSHSKVIVTHTASGKTAEFNITVKDPTQITKIEVTKQPTRVSYAEGEKLDLSGLVVTATYSDFTTEDVTSECTTLPSKTVPLTKGTTEVTVTHTPTSQTCKFGIYVSDPKIMSLTVTPPTKTNYKVGETLDLTGMIVKANWSDERTPTVVTSDCTTNPDTSTPLTPNHTKVTVTHTPTEKTCDFDITIYQSFQSDSWTNVINYANQGLAKLKEVYDVETFIGLERKVTINNKEHIVRVIGEEHDTIAGTSNKAALTFELVTLLSDTSGNEMTSKWDTTTNYDYTNSILRKNLSGTNDQASWGAGTVSDKRTALQMLPSDLKSGIKTVNKKIATYDNEKEIYVVKPEGYNDKLFPLTYTEMAQSGGYYAKVEGTAYKYWTDHNTDNDRIKKDAAGSSHYYRLVSPKTYHSSCAWFVGGNGYIHDYGYVYDTYAVSFGFCI